VRSIIITAAIFTLLVSGCASTRNTVGRLLGDIEYFQNKVAQYSILLSEKDSTKAQKALRESKRLLSAAAKSAEAGDKIEEKKYLSALVDIMDLLEEYR
jgi:hypothetical protein